MNRPAFDSSGRSVPGAAARPKDAKCRRQWQQSCLRTYPPFIVSCSRIALGIRRRRRRSQRKLRLCPLRMLARSLAEAALISRCLSSLARRRMKRGLLARSYRTARASLAQHGGARFRRFAAMVNSFRTPKVADRCGARQRPRSAHSARSGQWVPDSRAPSIPRSLQDRLSPVWACCRWPLTCDCAAVRRDRHDPLVSHQLAG